MLWCNDVVIACVFIFIEVVFLVFMLVEFLLHFFLLLVPSIFNFHFFILFFHRFFPSLFLRLGWSLLIYLCV